MQEVVITKSNRKDKRLKATFENKTIHFGYDQGKAFVDHNNKELKKAWLAGHRVTSDFSNIKSAGSLAKNILWNETSIPKAVKDLNTRQKKYKFRYET